MRCHLGLWLCELIKYLIINLLNENASLLQLCSYDILKKTKQNDCVIVTWLGTTLEVSVLKSLTHAFLPSGFIEFLQIPSGLSLTQTGHGKKLKIRPTTVNSKGKELVWEFLSWDLRQSPGLSLNLLWNRGILTSCPASLQGSPDTQMS